MSKTRIAAGGGACLVALTALAVVLAGSSSAKPSAAYKAALVSDVGRFNDKGFNQSQLTGLNRAKKALKISVLPIQSNGTSDYIPNLDTAVRQGSHLVIAAGFLMADSLATVAKQFPSTHFAITDDTVSTSSGDFQGKDVHNIEGLTYATNEITYNPGGRNPGFLYWLAWFAHNSDSFISSSDANGPVWRTLFVTSCRGLKTLAVGPILEQVLGTTFGCS